MAFESQWADWQPNGPIPGTDNTDKSPSVSFVSGSTRRISPVEGGEAPRNGLSTLTNKADKRCLARERAVLLQVPEGVAETWAQGIADLLVMQAPADWPPARWATLQEDARTFLLAWGGQACRLGWTAHDLFSVHSVASYARVDAMGLVTLLGGRHVAAITDDSAAIAVSAGTQSFLRRKAWSRECCLVWELAGIQPLT